MDKYRIVYQYKSEINKTIEIIEESFGNCEVWFTKYIGDNRILYIEKVV